MFKLSHILSVMLPISTLALVLLSMLVFDSGVIIFPNQVTEKQTQCLENEKTLESLKAEKSELGNTIQMSIETLNDYKEAVKEVENSNYREELIQQYAAATTIDVLEAKAIILNSLGYVPEDTYEDTSQEEFGMYVASLAVGSLTSKIASPVARKVVSHLILDSHDNMMKDGITVESVTKDTIAGINSEAKSFIKSKTKNAQGYYEALVEDDTTNSTDYLQHAMNAEALKTLEELQEYLEKETFDKEDFANMCEVYNKYCDQLKILGNQQPINNYKLNSLYEDYVTNINNLESLGVQ